jgi:hypothetical protein
MPSEFLGVAPWVVVSAAVTWGAQAWLYSTKRRDAKHQREDEQHDRLEIHRDELALQLLQSARQEMSAARVEVEDLREEVRKLRAMENHFYHFQQALEHLENLLFPESEEARANAERNARAFLARMRRLNQAKGTIANEAQRVASDISIIDQTFPLGGEKDKKGK